MIGKPKNTLLGLRNLFAKNHEKSSWTGLNPCFRQFSVNMLFPCSWRAEQRSIEATLLSGHTDKAIVEMACEISQTGDLHGSGNISRLSSSIHKHSMNKMFLKGCLKLLFYLVVSFK